MALWLGVYGETLVNQKWCECRGLWLHNTNVVFHLNWTQFNAHSADVSLKVGWMTTKLSQKLLTSNRLALITWIDLNKIMLLELTYYFLITLLVVHQHLHYVNMTQKNVQAPIDMESDVLEKSLIAFWKNLFVKITHVEFSQAKEKDHLKLKSL